MAYFLTSYTYATPFADYVPALFLSDPGAGDACRTAISATALAAYSRHIRSARHLEDARRQYAKALIQVNQLLARPETAVLDRTLGTVLVLGFFEAIVFEGGESPTSWTAHTLGSMQLLRLRGPPEAGNRLASHMYTHASNNIKTSCIQRSVPIPEDFMAFDAQAAITCPDVSTAWVKLSSLINKIASIKARARNEADVVLIQEALDLDEGIKALSESAPDWMQYQDKHRSSPSSGTYRGVLHEYPNARVAKIWNAIRLVRLFLIIFIYSAAGEDCEADKSRPGDEHQLSRSRLGVYTRQNMDTLTTEILASVPAFMEKNEAGTRFAPSGRSLVWPLGIIEETILSRKCAKEYATKYLHELAGDLNMPQVLHLSKQDISINAW